MSPSRLAEYQRKRSFDSTPEPAGRVTPRSAGVSTFVVQKHAASRLHYDFRLEHAGVLLSWAVPKGPSLQPADKRLAVHVEDHPREYFDFEGRIPKGEYGGGTVMVWDWGGVRWLGEDVDAMLARGDLKFELYGRKLKGAFALVGGRNGKDWLLIKKRDEGASDDPVTDLDRSVLSGRSMEEIAAARERVWHSQLDAGEQGGGGTSFIDLSGAAPARFPASIDPMLATPVSAAFDDPRWSYEIKLDGFRTLALIREGKVKLLSRRGHDATRQFPELAQLGVLLRGRDAALDGEVVALDDEGRPSFGLLQERTGWKGGRSATAPHPQIPIVYYCFDILHADGASLLEVPLVERRRLLAASLLDGPSVRRLDSFGGEDGKLLFEAVRQQGQEGVVAKRLTSKYIPGKRTKDWVKVKASRTQSCAIVGYTPPQGGRKHFGSLSVAVIAEGRLTYAGQVGSGFDEATLKALLAVVEPLSAADPGLDRHELSPRGVSWVQPALVCEVKYTEWTRDGVLRQPTFLGMSPDKAVADCVREDPAR
ncbi:MAG: non-homologous end-joining DNA ligase [Candidatus Dormibacteria bacterium]